MSFEFKKKKREKRKVYRNSFDLYGDDFPTGSDYLKGTMKYELPE